MGTVFSEISGKCVKNPGKSTVRYLLFFLLIFPVFHQFGYAKQHQLAELSNNLYGFEEKTEGSSAFSDMAFLNSVPQTQEFSLFRRRRSMMRDQALGVGANLLGPTLSYASVYLQYSFGRVVQAEAGIDLSAVYGGMNLYPHVFNRVEGLSPYMGLMVGYSDPLRQNIAKGIYAYMPVGFRYVTTDDWYVCIELAATTASNIRTAPMFLGIKLGYLFKRR